MKKLISGALFFVLTNTLMASGSYQSIYVGGPIEVDGVSYQVMTLSEINQDQATAFFAGSTPNTLLECKQDTVFPFRFSVTGAFLNTQNGEALQTVKLTKTCYIKCVEENSFFSGESHSFLFSSNLEEWKTFHDFFAVTVGISVKTADQETVINPDQRTLIEVKLELNEKI